MIRLTLRDGGTDIPGAGPLRILRLLHDLGLVGDYVLLDALAIVLVALDGYLELLEVGPGVLGRDQVGRPARRLVLRRYLWRLLVLV